MDLALLEGILASAPLRPADSRSRRRSGRRRRILADRPPGQVRFDCRQLTELWPDGRVARSSSFQPDRPVGDRHFGGASARCVHASGHGHGSSVPPGRCPSARRCGGPGADRRAGAECRRWQDSALSHGSAVPRKAELRVRPTTTACIRAKTSATGTATRVLGRAWPRACCCRWVISATKNCRPAAKRESAAAATFPLGRQQPATSLFARRQCHCIHAHAAGGQSGRQGPDVPRTRRISRPAFDVDWRDSARRFLQFLRRHRGREERDQRALRPGDPARHAGAPGLPGGIRHGCPRRGAGSGHGAEGTYRSGDSRSPPIPARTTASSVPIRYPPTASMCCSPTASIATAKPGDGPRAATPLPASRAD